MRPKCLLSKFDHSNDHHQGMQRAFADAKGLSAALKFVAQSMSSEFGGVGFAECGAGLSFCFFPVEAWCLDWGSSKLLAIGCRRLNVGQPSSCHWQELLFRVPSCSPRIIPRSRHCYTLDLAGLWLPSWCSSRDLLSQEQGGLRLDKQGVCGSPWLHGFTLSLTLWEAQVIS